MKLKMKLKNFGIVTVLIFLFNLSGFAQSREVAQDLEDFREIKVTNGLEVRVIPSEENFIEITGHSKNEIKISVVEDLLEIKLSLNNLWSKDDTKITIFGNSIEGIDARQGSVVEIEGHLKAEELNLRVQEGAVIHAQVNAGKTTSKAVTGGKIFLRGKSELLEVDLNTGGQFFGNEFHTKETVVKAGTTARAEIYATEYVRATATLGGSIEIYGRPKEVEQKTSLGGKIL